MNTGLVTPVFRHPFDKRADRSDEEIAQAIVKVGRSSKNASDEDEENLNLIDKLVFDERVDGLSDSCIDLMRKLMHPDPDKRMTSEEFRRHPWVQGLTASWKVMSKTHADLENYWQNHFRAEIVKIFASTTGRPRAGRGSQPLPEHEIDSIFNALDVTQKGVLELDDIAHAFRDSGFSTKDIQQLFTSADLDGTGCIHRDEFRALMSKTAGKRKRGKEAGPGLQVRYLQNRFKSHVINKFTGEKNIAPDKSELREIFNAFDLEGNGVLDAHEIRVVLRSVGEPEDVISRIVASLDADRDGGVSWEEFQEVMGLETD